MKNESVWVLVAVQSDGVTEVIGVYKDQKLANEVLQELSATSFGEEYWLQQSWVY